MNIPCILVLDDQYARDDAERWLFVDHANLIIMESDEVQERKNSVDNFIAQVVFCSGQRQGKDSIINDYDVVQEAVLERDDWAMVLLDVRFDSGPLLEGIIPLGQPGDESFGEIVSQRLAEDYPDLPVVMLSSMRQQDLDDQHIPYLSKEGLGERELKNCLLQYGRLSCRQTQHLLGLGKGVVAQSRQMTSVFREAYIHAEENVSMMILGESGSGKEVLGSYIHRISKRSGPFIAVNVAAIPKDLLESELFGIEKGAATGVDQRPGKFELANGGTLFLDEIGDMPLDAQAKVLRALQEREVVRVGGTKLIPLDIRLITATSRDLPKMIANREFREDLYYRINAVPLILPPLRDRLDDIEPLAISFLEKYMMIAGKSGITFSDEAINSILTHSYPGNVRELENIMQRIISGVGNNRVISGNEIIKVLELPDSYSPAGQIAPIENNYQQEKQSELSEITISKLIELMGTTRLNINDPSLSGSKLRLESAFKDLLQRLAGASLERCRDPVTGGLNRQRAMQFLTGDVSLKGKGPARVINNLIGRRLEDRVSEDDLDALIAKWKDAERKCVECDEN